MPLADFLARLGHEPVPAILMMSLVGICSLLVKNDACLLYTSESKANKYTFVWKKTVEKNRAKLLEKTSAALAQIKEQIQMCIRDSLRAIP